MFKTLLSIALFATVCLHGEPPTSPLKVGIISAVPAESGRLVDQLESRQSDRRGGRTYHQGKLQGIDTVLVASRIGKVAAATAAAHLISEYGVNFVIFVGVAGAVDPALEIGDVIVAHSLVQHDLDARPFCARYMIPLLNICECLPDPLLTSYATEASQKALTQLPQQIPASTLATYKISQPKIHTGLVVTGDQVIATDAQKSLIKEQLPDALCVEMEGAAVGQVCHEYEIPFVVIRVVSDYCSRQHTPVDIKQFVSEVSGYYATAIVHNLYQLMSEKGAVCR